MKSTKNNIAALSVFTNVQEFIALTNVSPLLSSSVKVNKDQVNELGDAVDQEFPFASIDTGFAESNDGLLFALYFYETGVSVGYSGGENSWIDYGELGSTSKNVSAQLIKLLTIFANGQLKVLLTCLDDEEHIQAIEVIYRKPGSRTYDAIGTTEHFLPKRKLKNGVLTTSLFANTARIDEVTIDVTKTLKLLFPETDGEVMNAIGRKNILDLNEPLTPESLEERIDAYAEEVGARAYEKVEASVNEAFSPLDIAGMSMWEQFIYFARWRHIELIFWSFALLAAPSVAAWALADIHPAALLIGALVIPLYVFRGRYPYPKTLYLLAPVAYAAFVVSSIVFLHDFIVHWVTIVVAFFAVVSLGENMFFDGYFTRQKIITTVFNWAKK